MGQSPNSLVAVSTVDRAQAFTTGADRSTLSSVEIVSADLDDDDMAVSVCDVDVNDYPASDCRALTPPRSFAAGTLVFTASTTVNLDANRTYTLLVTSPGGETLQFGSTPYDHEDTGGAAGWSIANESHRKSPSTNMWGPTVTRLAFRITIKGTTTATVTAPRVETAIPDQTATAGRAFSYAFPDNTFTDLDGDTLSYMATKADDAALPTWLNFAATTRAFSGRPATGDVGTVSVKVTASDSNGGSVSDTFDIVASTNNPPTASNGEVTASEDTDYAFTAANFNFSDTNSGDALFSVKITSVPAMGTLQVDGTALTSASTVTKVDIDASKLTYSPPANANGDTYATFQFKVNDGMDDSATVSTMTISVTAVNDAPTVATPILDQTPTAGTAFSYGFSGSTFNDADGDTLSYMATKADNAALPTWLNFAATTRIFSGTPQAADVGTVSVTVTASDGNSGSVSDTFDIVVSVSVPGTTVPGAPTSLSATAGGTTQINLTWTAPASNGGLAIFGYKIEVSSDGGSSWSNLVANTSNTTYPHSGLAAGATRHYRVSAINTNGAGVPAVTNATTGTTVPGAPTSLSATAGGTTINLSWTAPGNNGGAAITGYKIEVSSDDGMTWTDLVADTTSTGTTYPHTGLAAGATRHYRVSAINTNGAGASSGIDSATTDTTGNRVGGGGGSVGGGGGGGGGGPSPSDVDFEWNVKRDIEDLAAGNTMATGIWSDGETLWVADNADGAGDAVYAYDLATGERLEAREFELAEANRAPRGVWSDRETVWVSDSGQERLFAYDLATGERVEAHEIVLDEDNGDTRGIWSDDETMWVLDGSQEVAIYLYDLASRELIARYALDNANDDPHGIWSDGVTVWVSDHNAKRLFAYRLEDGELVRNSGEEFTELSGASNNSPRGLWSDGDVMYVADASDGRVYTYNMPDAIDARLASLTLSGVDIGEFTVSTTEYVGVVGEGVTETTVEAKPAQDGASVNIDQPDANAEAEGHQVALDGIFATTVTVTSADGSRKKTYRVRLAAEEVAEPVPEEAASPAPDEAAAPASCLRGDITVGFSLVVYGGGSVEDLDACGQSRNVTAVYTLDGGEYLSYVLGAPGFVNDRFRELYAGGVPALTPLIARSDGPATAAAVAAGVPGPWAACLPGEIVEGFNLVLYAGGSVDDLDACAEEAGLASLYVLDDGVWVSYILGAPEFVNREFRELFTDGVPVAAPLVGKRD